MIKQSVVTASEVEDVDKDMIDIEEGSYQAQIAKDYFLMHRRFAYLNSNIIVKLHEVITYSPIRRPKHRTSCSTCAIEKMKKKINRVVTSRKKNILNLVSIDACGPLSKSLVENTTFLEIVDNHSRKI